MPPNVALASTLEEQQAVVARVDRALSARDPRSVAKLLEFGEAVRQSAAVVNVSVRYAIEFLVSETPLYATYAKLVEAGARRPAAFQNDAQRRSTEARLFGSFADEMRYAALSLGGLGLVSYGAVTMVLRDVAISQRASVLEENSYSFIERLGLGPHDCIPRGHRAPWSTRHQLAMAKCAPMIGADTVSSEYPRLVLDGIGDRGTDTFVEVYVFGPFGRGAIEKIILPVKLPKDVPRSELRILRAKAKSRSIPVEDV